MDQAVAHSVIKQHLIDPEICIRCNTCEATCPVGAITHDDNNYVVRADVCNACMACISPCPTGSIDNWRTMPLARAYTIEEQLTWEELPPELSPDDLAAESAVPSAEGTEAPSPSVAPGEPGTQVFRSAQYGATLPPWSAAHPYTNLFPPKSPTTATVVGNFNCTEAGFESETHHVVLDFGSMPFPVLEGQSIGIIPPGTDALGKAHHARQYSIASPRNGERPGYNNLALTVKRVTQDYDGLPVQGIASNYICDLKVGDRVQVVGPFGSSFLMPNHPRSHIVMICTGTGSAPMRAMTEWRRRLRSSGKFEGGKLMLFFGARTQQELPYFGPLQNLPKDFIDINLAFSRTAGQPRRYVQDLMRERAADLAALLRDDNSHFYVCGLKSMEEGVVMALRDIASEVGLDWDTVGAILQREGRLHLETY
ncbi:MAG: benzoyl-CoA 2,3-epoxidase subunit BoxA [Acidovorax sp.]|uniref:benzoyl-CoA 2,3-epoxidase subunit BoxA n=1 Tax=Acidovorax sp. TaxID=1872122 RepID=UPI0022C52466|nr:benzoyl-CoA 2,3-epoxidase subunit BoxA [Acidovorax sp.]MCZ8218567.1 benzoyl-CoA 2,3-epoxidase subunit BoxA [Acidovorax sp.]